VFSGKHKEEDMWLKVLLKFLEGLKEVIKLRLS